MDQFAREYEGRTHFLFIYAREAHPDRFPDHPAHKTIEQKWQHARDLQERFQSPRTFLVDGLDGEVHRRYSGRPNMSWVIDHTGRVAFKGGWTVAQELREALQMVFQVREMKRDGVRVNPYYKEVMAYKPSREGRESAVPPEAMAGRPV